MNDLDQSVETTSETPVADSAPEAESVSFREAVESAMRELNPESDEDTQASGEKAETETKEAKPSEDEETVEMDKLPPSVRKLIDKEVERYKNLQSFVSKKQNEWKETSEKVKTLSQVEQQWNALNELYTKNPKLQAAIAEALGVSADPGIDPMIAEDPVYQEHSRFKSHIESKLNPILERLEAADRAREQKELESRVDRIEMEAVADFKSLLGKEPTAAEKRMLFETIIENKLFQKPGAAVRLAFEKQIHEAITQRALEAQRAKRGVTSKTSSVAPAKVSGKSDNLGFRDALTAAAEELGIQL